ncbi:rCG49500 [Rattus norvegicus]|uniref:RCG49500 n=1 Tax=Rattus norvegicus TaxID=10116 RepID=A6J2Q6_RAT|nr:rCG49500 [Rattus norvegicus]
MDPASEDQTGAWASTSAEEPEAESERNS